MKLHLGCGTIYLKNYINIDSAPDYFTDKCPSEILEQNFTTYENYYKKEFGKSSGKVVADLKSDLMDRFPFDDKSIDEIVMYQVLEHIPLYNVDKILSEISRVLKTDGIFKVCVPDVKETAKLLVESLTESEEDWAIRLIHGTQRNKWSHHYCGYTLRILKNVLLNHNFIKFEELPSINFYPVIHLKAIKG